MDYADIRRLVKLVETSNISEFEIEEGGAKLRIMKQSSVVTQFVNPQMVQPQQAYAPAPLTGVPIAPAISAVPQASKTIDVLSPMVGTFYRAPSPDAPAYVQVGDMVRSGQALCIVEAMKLMNEIESEAAGRVVEIVPQNAQAVEFGQVLFRIEPA